MPVLGVVLWDTNPPIGWPAASGHIPLSQLTVKCGDFWSKPTKGIYQIGSLDTTDIYEILTVVKEGKLAISWQPDQNQENIMQGRSPMCRMLSLNAAIAYNIQIAQRFTTLFLAITAPLEIMLVDPECTSQRLAVCANALWKNKKNSFLMPWRQRAPVERQYLNYLLSLEKQCLKSGNYKGLLLCTVDGVELFSTLEPCDAHVISQYLEACSSDFEKFPIKENSRLYLAAPFVFTKLSDNHCGHFIFGFGGGGGHARGQAHGQVNGQGRGQQHPTLCIPVLSLTNKPIALIGYEYHSFRLILAVEGHEDSTIAFLDLIRNKLENADEYLSRLPAVPLRKATEANLLCFNDIGQSGVYEWQKPSENECLHCGNNIVRSETTLTNWSATEIAWCERTLATVMDYNRAAITLRLGSSYWFHSRKGNGRRICCHGSEEGFLIKTINNEINKDILVYLKERLDLGYI